MMQGPWSDEEDRRLIELRVSGHTFHLISKALRRSQASCSGRWYTKIKKVADSSFRESLDTHDAQ